MMRDQLIGDWQGTTKTWFEPGKLADESPSRGTIRAVGQALCWEYAGSIQGQPHEGVMLISFGDDGTTSAAWADSFHYSTGIFACEGEGPAVLGHYEAPSGPPWGWRTEFEVVGPDEILITAYNITPDGNEAKAVETRYRRA